MSELTNGGDLKKSKKVSNKSYHVKELLKRDVITVSLTDQSQHT